MPRLIGLVLARNEADKFLKPVLTRLLAVCDSVLLLDDNSTDDTYAIAKEMGCSVKKRTKPPMWGEEASARQELWEWGVSRRKDNDWLLICDADQELVGDPQTPDGLMGVQYGPAATVRLLDRDGVQGRRILASPLVPPGVDVLPKPCTT
jgi:glycosyltransferase involved in cell wall biosynthesis